LSRRSSASTAIRSQSYPTGAIVANYRPDGGVRTGDFQLAAPTDAELERRRNLRCSGAGKKPDRGDDSAEHQEIGKRCHQELLRTLVHSSPQFR
jgi:hypothetical protein